jgi:hypothetical protein
MQTEQTSKQANETTAQTEPADTTLPPVSSLNGEPIVSHQQTITWLLLAALITLTYALSSSIATVLIPHISAIVMFWLSMVALGIWFGGLAYLAYILLPVLLNTEIIINAETRATILNRLAPIILGGMCIWLVSDLFLSEASITTPQQLLTDPFGRTLCIQIVMILIAVILSLYALLTVQPAYIRQALLLPVSKAQLPTRQARQSSVSGTRQTLTLITKVLTFCGAAILLCASLQAFFAPPITFPTASVSKNVLTPQQNTSTTGNSQQIGNMQASLQVLPPRVGVDHTVILTITNSQGQPITDAQVTLTTNMVIMDMGTHHATLTRTGPVYTTTIKSQEAFSMAGAWNIDVAIQRPGQKAVTGTFNVTLT